MLKLLFLAASFGVLGVVLGDYHDSYDKKHHNSYDKKHEPDCCPKIVHPPPNCHYCYDDHDCPKKMKCCPLMLKFYKKKVCVYPVSKHPHHNPHHNPHHYPVGPYGQGSSYPGSSYPGYPGSSYPGYPGSSYPGYPGSSYPGYPGGPGGFYGHQKHGKCPYKKPKHCRPCIYNFHCPWNQLCCKCGYGRKCCMFPKHKKGHY